MRRFLLLVVAAAALLAAACGGAGESGEPVAATDVQMVKSYRFDPKVRYVELEVAGLDADAAIPGCARTWKGAPPAARSTRACTRSSAASRPSDAPESLPCLPSGDEFACVEESGR